MLIQIQEEELIRLTTMMKKKKWKTSGIREEEGIMYNGDTAI
jgi:hypothetical protein